MTWLLRGLAVVFALGAVIAALIGYRLSTQPAPPAQLPAPVETAVQALRPLRAGEPIRAEDVALKPVPAKPAGSFAAPAQVVGQSPLADLAAGETLTRAHFPTAGQLVRGLHPGERAVAIKVDEVVGLGGFAQPGDRVDVLLHLRASQETGNASSAQVVLAGVRLLAFGESVQPPAGEGEGLAERAAEKVSGVSGRARTTTSAVLAVPEAAASRLMLAASSGTLRLSLRPVETAAAGTAGNPHLVRLGELAHGQPAAKAAVRRKGAAPILLHEGEAVRPVAAPR